MAMGPMSTSPWSLAPRQSTGASGNTELVNRYGRRRARSFDNPNYTGRDEPDPVAEDVRSAEVPQGLRQQDQARSHSDLPLPEDRLGQLPNIAKSSKHAGVDAHMPKSSAIQRRRTVSLPSDPDNLHPGHPHTLSTVPEVPPGSSSTEQALPKDRRAHSASKPRKSSFSGVVFRM